MDPEQEPLLNSRKEKATDEELDYMVDEIIKMKLEKSSTNFQVIEFLIAKYGYKQTMCYRLIAKANQKLLKVFSETEIKDTVNIRMAEYETQRNKALEDDDRRLWKEITTEMNRLKGLYVEQVEVRQTVIDVIVKGEEQKSDEA